MPSETVFWAIAAGFGLMILALVFAPLMRGRARAGRRSSYDMQVYRDQIREIDADLARGVLEAREAEASRAEVARRLLAAAEAEAGETDAATEPRAASRVVGALAIVAGLAGAVWLYATIGRPGYGDQPLEARRALMAEAYAGRPDQATAEAMIAADAAAPPAAQVAPADAAMVERLAAALEDRPDDIEGFRLLARSMAALGRWSEAHAAQARVVELRGAAATAGELVEWGELMIIAANGYVSPEAEGAIRRALEIDPGDPLGRYYAGLSAAQGGRPEIAYDLWMGLLRDGPPDAPWIAAVYGQIDEIARMAGMPPPDPPSGPTRDEMEAAAALSAEEREAMIAGMVDQLGGRLETEGGPPEDWARLIRSLGVMGRIADAAEAWDAARTAYADDPAALAVIEQAARDGEVIQ